MENGQPKKGYSIPKLLRSEEVAEILNISESLAIKLMKNGDIPTVRFGRSVRVRPQDLEDYIKGHIGK